MKICIELSGYLRTCVAIPTLISKFKGHEIDWYIHTYANDLYVANPIKDFPERKRADIEKIFNYINPIALEIEENSIVLKEINHLFRFGKTTIIFPLMVYCLEAKEPKVLYSISKKKINKAVDRNKIKRQ